MGSEAPYRLTLNILVVMCKIVLVKLQLDFSFVERVFVLGFKIRYKLFIGKSQIQVRPKSFYHLSPYTMMYTSEISLQFCCFVL